MSSANYYIEQLGLQSHPEGGYYRETYRSALEMSPNCIKGFEGDRSLLTSIYFLLEQENFSAFHRIKSDELWNFHFGDTLEIIEITNEGALIVTNLGSRPETGEKFQHVVSAGNWFASRVKTGGSFSLVGCSVSPGFDFRDFEMADRKSLMREFPQHDTIIRELSR